MFIGPKTNWTILQLVHESIGKTLHESPGNMVHTQDATLFSIITVCRNSAVTIPSTFESVLQQSYRHIDYVVIDGASTDNTVEIIKAYEPRFLSKVHQFRWISEPDEGIYDAMNKGISLCKGDIIGILNSDDYYEPNALQTVSEAINLYPDVGIFYGYLRFLKEGKELQVYRYRYENYLLNLSLGIHSAVQHPTCFVRKGVYERVGTFDTQFRISADYDFLIRAIRKGIKFQPLDTILCNFRSGGATAQISDVEKHQQHYAIWYKNGLISQREHKALKRNLIYNKLKSSIKQKFFKWLIKR